MLLQLNGVSKRLGTFHIKDISLELPEGYIMGLIGQNGAGKTTLLHLILGLYQPDEGEIRIDGVSYKENEREIREKTGYVLLDDFFDNSMTLLQNGSFYGRYYVNYNEEVLQAYLKRFSLEPDRKYKTLSKGEKLKFQFAFALAHDARLLILDEPTGNFDPEFRREFFEVLKEFIADGTRSVILSTHLTKDLDRVADYITYLENGEMMMSYDIEEYREKYRLVTGETYKLNLIPKERVIHMEPGEFGSRALVTHHRRYTYDASVTVAVPTLEEFMYFMSKRKKTSERRGR